MNLPDDEAADLRILLGRFRLLLATTDQVVAHVADLCDAYRAQGYVMGNLAHDGTLKAQAEAGEQ